MFRGATRLRSLTWDVLAAEATSSGSWSLHNKRVRVGGEGSSDSLRLTLNGCTQPTSVKMSMTYVNSEGMNAAGQYLVRYLRQRDSYLSLIHPIPSQVLFHLV